MANQKVNNRAGVKSCFLLLIPAFVMIITLVFFRTVFLIGYVPSESMEPALEKESIILGYRLYREINVSDIVIFEHEGEVMVKRVAACARETITIGEQSWAVPDNCYFLIGDNTDNSYNSRYWEDSFVPAKKVIAKYLFH